MRMYVQYNTYTIHIKIIIKISALKNIYIYFGEEEREREIFSYTVICTLHTL